MRSLVFFTLLVGLSLVHPQIVMSQLLTGDQLPGLKIEKETTYDGTSLYGYIDGGSTLYFEYGFDRLTVQEMVFLNEKLTIEYYRMKTCKAAFGIYSINTFQCASSDQQGMINCENQYQNQLFAGHHYLSVVNTTGTQKARNASSLLIKRLKEIIPLEEGLLLPEQISTHSGQLTGTVKFINGELGLQNGLPDWSNYFEGMNSFELWMRQIPSEGKDFKKVVIAFSNPAALETFVHNASLVPTDTGWKSAEDKTERWIVAKVGEQMVVVDIR